MKPSTKRLASFTLAFLMVIGSLVVFFSLIRPAYSESQKIKGEILSKENSLKNQQNAATQVRNLIQQYRGNDNIQEAVSNALPRVGDQAETVNALQALAAMNQMVFQSISVTQPGAKPLNKQSLVRPVGVLGAQVRVAGTYENFKNFMASLETNVRLTDVQTLVVAPVGKSNQDFYTFDISLNTYYQEN